MIRCRYCNTDIFTKNFMRHLERQHSSEPEIIEILTLPKKSKERKEALAVLRNETNFDLYLNGQICPKRRKVLEDPNSEEKYYPCIYCKGVFKKHYMRRHVKNCSTNKKNNKHCLAKSQTLVACHLDPTNVISKLNVKEIVSIINKVPMLTFKL